MEKTNIKKTLKKSLINKDKKLSEVDKEILKYETQVNIIEPINHPVR